MDALLAVTLTPAGLSRAVAHRLGLESDDRRMLGLMGALVAVLFGAYTIAKVLRDALFLAQYSALALPYMYVAVALAAAGFVWLDTAVVQRSTRLGALRVQQALAIALGVLFAIAHHAGGRWTAAAFYVWTGSQAMMLLPHFWALALDVWDSRRARSVFPFLGGCGLFGGLVAGGVAAWTVRGLGRTGLMWILVGLLAVAFALTRVVEQHRARGVVPADQVASQSSWTILRRSTYLQVFVVALALAVVMGTLVDFQFKVFLQRQYPDSHDLTRFLGKFYVGLNALSLLFQFTAAGWALRRLGLGPATSLQPITAVLFTSWMAVSPVWWAVVSLRWVQSVAFGTLGKSSAEIYYTAIHPRERRRIKPAIDTLVERWSDAAVGVLLVVLLHVIGVSTHVVAIVTLVLAALWLGTLVVLDRQFGRAFERILSSRWIGAEETPEAIRTPSARRALLAAMREGDERRIVLALNLCRAARHADVAGQVRACLEHPSPAVRVAAVDAMRAMRLPDASGVIAGLVHDPDDALRRAAVAYGLAVGPDRTAFARRLLEGDDPVLRHDVVDALFDRPDSARGALTVQWVHDRLRAGTREDRLLAARAAGAMSVRETPRWLRTLLSDPDAEVRRLALASATRRPAHELVDVLVPLLLQPELSDDAREALSAIGGPAVPALERLLGHGRDPRAQVLAVRTLVGIATPRAMGALFRLVRTTDARLRYLGLQGMSRVRIARGEAVLPRALVCKLFLRELADYRANALPALALAAHPGREIRLLVESFGEAADMALERAFLALACWYEPRPLAGAFEHLRGRDPAARAPALEYLGQILPRGTFRPVERIFEEELTADEPARDAVDDATVADAVASAWRSGDAWMRACAVRASRGARALDPHLFDDAPGDEPLVQDELQALAQAAGGGAC